MVTPENRYYFSFKQDGFFLGLKFPYIIDKELREDYNVERTTRKLYINPMVGCKYNFNKAMGIELNFGFRTLPNSSIGSNNTYSAGAKISFAF
jgi:hypothetical protein